MSHFSPKEPASMMSPAISPEGSFWAWPPTAAQILPWRMAGSLIVFPVLRNSLRLESGFSVLPRHHHVQALGHFVFCAFLNPDKYSADRQVPYILIDLALKLEHCWTLVENECFPVFSELVKPLLTMPDFPSLKGLSFRRRATRCHKWGSVLPCSLWFLLQGEMVMYYNPLKTMF